MENTVLVANLLVFAINLYFAYMFSKMLRVLSHGNGHLESEARDLRVKYEKAVEQVLNLGQDLTKEHGKNLKKLIASGTEMTEKYAHKSEMRQLIKEAEEIHDDNLTIKRQMANMVKEMMNNAGSGGEGDMFAMIPKKWRGMAQMLMQNMGENQINQMVNSMAKNMPPPESQNTNPQITNGDSNGKETNS